MHYDIILYMSHLYDKRGYDNLRTIHESGRATPQVRNETHIYADIPGFQDLPYFFTTSDLARLEELLMGTLSFCFEAVPRATFVIMLHGPDPYLLYSRGGSILLMFRQRNPLFLMLPRRTLTSYVPRGKFVSFVSARRTFIHWFPSGGFLDDFAHPFGSSCPWGLLTTKK